MIKRIFAVLMAQFISVCVFAQFVKKKLAIGDMCPDVKISQIINHSLKEAKISDFRGKLLILDFWATWCSPCVSFFKVADSLQKKFGDQILILPVTYQDEKTVSKFLTRMSNITGILPPTVVNDSILQTLFTHNEIPHEVWIDKNGVIKAITNETDVNSRNIQAFLDGQAISLSEKKDLPLLKYNYSLPIFSGDQKIGIEKDNLLFHSVLTKYTSQLGGSFVTGKNFISCRNATIAWLFKIAYGKHNPVFSSDTRLILEVSDTSIVTFPNSWSNNQTKWNAWKWDNLYCYELSIGDSLLAEQKFEIMQEDLRKYFRNFSGRVEKRKSMGWVLTQTSDNIKFRTKGQKASAYHDAYTIKITNKPVSELMGLLQGYFYQFSPYPIIDELNFKENIDIELNGKISDMQSLNNALANYDLRFVQKEVEVDMIIIKQNNK